MILSARHISELENGLAVLEADAAAALQNRAWARLAVLSQAILATAELLLELEALRQSQPGPDSMPGMLRRLVSRCDAALERVNSIEP